MSPIMHLFRYIRSSSIGPAFCSLKSDAPNSLESYGWGWSQLWKFYRCSISIVISTLSLRSSPLHEFTSPQFSESQGTWVQSRREGSTRCHILTLLQFFPMYRVSKNDPVSWNRTPFLERIKQDGNVKVYARRHLHSSVSQPLFLVANCEENMV